MKFKHLLAIIVFSAPLFCQAQSTPKVTLKKIASHTAISAVCICETEGVTNISEEGVCWSLSQNPTINDDHASCGTSPGKYIARIYGLNDNTTYHIRAYMKTASKTFYSEDVILTTEVFPEGAIRGVFSISDTKQVLFSKGNLQYQATTNTWRFAENQYDFVGDDIRGNVMENGVKCDNSLIAPDYDGWIDLFGWGTSGWDNGNVFYHPYDYYADSIDGNHGFGYGPTDGFSYLFNLTGDYAEADWGIHNPIINGGNQAGQWRTLTPEEWNYIIGTLANGRPNASEKKYSATIKGVPGVIILPDYWVCPDNITFSTNPNYQNNEFTIAQWQELEEAGAVFLPSAGNRTAQHTSLGPGSMINGYYWLAQYDTNEKSARFYNVFKTGVTISTNNLGHHRNNGYSVRLVKTN